ncbi:hypothetical protein BBK36DRAFT_1122058 [Trichoderma citrinoviride]|uniref:ADF-H domain-containing protein n=1 Tax=Trichoderma citrinoviride TaxID=58853 RepID=A0A2T4B759_9HYPO|nr:hypothetical protein BBK36DRAFT_1122058 [Trichoderma citrinoviride]PTB65157.1 hypothetical protein BBK36DRAFT_1122058 [Trichoderma citrinoviride]
MSLNGLDDPKVVEAHEAGVAEAGGWFLLKYSSRDEVELLEKGNGGIAEMRNAIAGFEEESPLYGFLRYRRRNVIVKYLPEDCSRLIQARVAVHFGAVCERFAPYDTIYEISTAAELRDTKLSAACSLHAASGSTASSVSSRRRRLGEIAEEDEEEQRSPKRQSLELSDDDRPRTPGSRSTAADEVKLNSELASSPEHRKFSTSSTSEVPKFVGVTDRPASPTRSFDTTDSYNYYPLSKPKVKLAPRPTTDVTIRPKASGDFRPVSSLPAGIKLFGKSGRKGRGKDDDAASSIHEDIPEVELPADSTTGTIPESLRRPSGDSSRPSTGAASSADTLSVPAVPAKPTMTPEKARLMKAMKLREKKKKQLLLQQQKQSADGAESGVDTPGSEGKKATTEEDDGKKKDMTHSEEITGEDHEEDGNDGLEAEEGNTQENEQKKKSDGTEDAATSISQADSGVVLDSLSSSVQIDEVSEGTRSESRPLSPAVDPSEHDQSTTASSLSDSTDETVHAKRPDEVTTDGAKVDVVTATDAAGESAGVLAAEEDEENSEPAAAVISNPAGSWTALEPADEIAAAGAANKGSAKAENEKEKKGIAVPISKFSAHMPMSKAPPAALLDGLGSGAGEIPLGATPGDVAQATDKGGQGLGLGLGLAAGAAATAAAAPPSPSKASTQDLVDAANAAAATHTTVATPAMELELQTDPLPLPAAHEAIPAAATASDAAAPPDEPSDADEAQQQPSKEHDPGALPRPIRTDLALAGSGSSSSDRDDDALVQEATPTAHLPAAPPPPPLQGHDAAAHRHDQPMAASKSPPTPVFPSAPIANGPLGARAPPAHTVRTVSNPVRGNFIAPTDVTQSTARSLSSGAAFLHKVTQQQSASLATMKPNVGSSISQRIKALEKLSATSGDQSRPVSRERPSSTFFAVQKRDTSRPPSVVDRTKSLHGRAASPTPSHQDDALEGRVRLQRSGSVVSRVSMFEPLAAVASSAASASSPPPPGLAPGTQSRGRPESVAITTKFAGYELPPKDASSEYGGYQSPLTADQHRGDEGSERRPRSLERRGEDDMGRRSSLNVVKGFFKDPRKTVTVSTNMRHAIASRTTTQSPSSASHRLSMSSRRSITLDRDGFANSSVTEDSFSGDESSPSDRKTSRAGRFMRKLSNLSSGSKNKTTSPSPEVTRGAQNAAASVGSPSGDASIVSDLGDVNVQFPDSLLWKRRNLCLDSHGFIILSALPAQSSRMAQGTKKYHMGEFRQPYTPDVEVQELPNSVVLDFVEGTGIQLACEDRTGQLNVLHVLQAAHANHSR